MNSWLVLYPDKFPNVDSILAHLSRPLLSIAGNLPVRVIWWWFNLLQRHLVNRMKSNQNSFLNLGPTCAYRLYNHSQKHNYIGPMLVYCCDQPSTTLDQHFSNFGSASWVWWVCQASRAMVRVIACHAKGARFKLHFLYHSDLRDYISDTTRSFRRMHAWRLTRFISR